MLKYKFHYTESDRTKELSYNEALDMMLGYYRDNDMTRDMLMIPNAIIFKPYGTLIVTDHQSNGITLTAMPGLYNLLPNDIGYDTNGNHLE